MFLARSFVVMKFHCSNSGSFFETHSAIVMNADPEEDPKERL